MLGTSGMYCSTSFIPRLRCVWLETQSLAYPAPYALLRAPLYCCTVVGYGGTDVTCNGEGC